MIPKNRQSTGVGLVFVVFLTMLATTAPASPLPDFELGGGKGACVAPAIALTDGSGCRLLIAGAYTDASGNNFQILDVSSTNQARIEFVEGTINKLILTGATFQPTATVTNATITFKHVFADGSATLSNVSNTARNNLSGGYSVQSSTVNRTVEGTGFAELCPVSSILNNLPPSTCSPTGPPALTAAPSPLVGTIPAGKLFGSFVVGPENQAYSPPGSFTKPVLKGKIKVSTLKVNEKVSNISHTLLAADTNNMPPFDSGSLCVTDEDIGRIIRSSIADGICIKTDDGEFKVLPGPEALSLAGASCPLSIEEELNGLKQGENLLHMIEILQQKLQ